jgi:hypothetical protein
MAYIFDLVDTWALSGGPYTSIKMNATDNDAASASLLMDLQVGGASKFKVAKSGDTTFTLSGGTITISNSIGLDVGTFSVSRVASVQFGPGNDLVIGRRTSASLRLGNADAAAPVAQTFGVQSGTAGASALACSISGTTLTVGTVTGTIAVGHAVTGTGVTAGTTIVSGAGSTWVVSASQTVSSTTMYFNSVGQNLTLTGSQGSGPSAGGSIIFQVAPAGSAATTAQNALATALTINSATQAIFAGTIAFQDANGTIINSEGVTIATGRLGWRNGVGTSVDLVLTRDDANKLALRNGTAAQAFNIYNTYTDASNYERINIAYSSGIAYVETSGAGTGAQRNLTVGGAILDFRTGLNSRWTINGSGHFITALDNTYDIGASGATRPRNVYVAGTVTSGGVEAPTYYATSATRMRLGETNGNVRFHNAVDNNFGLMIFGTATSSFPALKRSSTTLQARLADDSAFASVQGKLTTDTAYTAGAPTATGYLVVYDSAGTAYKIPAVAV